MSPFRRGMLVPEFEDALSALPIGEVAGTPVETRYGLHVTAVDGRIDGAELPFEIVHPKIAAWLAERVRRTAVHQYICVLASRATICGIDLGTGDTPLVQ